jgi:LruC domain-containing protein
MLSCSSEVISISPPVAEDMASLVVPDDFNFEMYGEVQLQLTNVTSTMQVQKIQVKRVNCDIPIYTSLDSSLKRHHFITRLSDSDVEVSIFLDNGRIKNFILPIVNRIVSLDLNTAITSHSIYSSTKTACTDSLANDNGGAAANSFGYGTKIQSVTQNGANYDITIQVAHNGCGGSNCKALSHYAIEVDSGNLVGIPVFTPSTGMSGNLVYGLPQYAFDGFKIDNTSGIGGGIANTFLVTYTVGSLQNQRFVAKAGNSYDRIAAFTSADFTCVMNNSAPPAVDTDGDGVLDGIDEFPNNPSLSHAVTTDTATFVAEDNWPWEGDYDFNDVVMPYVVKTFYNSDNELVKSRLIYLFKARGASFANGIGFSYLTDPSNVSVSGYYHSEPYHNSVDGVEIGSSNETSIIFEDLISNKLSQWNTFRDIPTVHDSWDSVDVNFSAPVNASVAATINFFLIKDKIRGKEIHLPNELPTFLADQNLIGSGLDAGNPAEGIYYKQINGKPWALKIPGIFKYPFEQTEITLAYLNFLSWAQSGGLENTDWYNNDVPTNIDSYHIYSEQ